MLENCACLYLKVGGMEHQQEMESREWQNHCLHHFAAMPAVVLPGNQPSWLQQRYLHSRSPSPLPLLPKWQSLQLGRSQMWWCACNPCAPSVNVSSITETQWQQRKQQGRCQLSDATRGCSGRRNQNLCYSATYWEASDFQPVALLESEGGLGEALPSKKDVWYFKCARRGTTHQAQWRTMVTWYHKEKMKVLHKPNFVSEQWDVIHSSNELSDRNSTR